MATTLFGVMPGKTSAQILAVKSFYDPEFCNLTECVVRGWDDTKSLKKKVRFATILGTWQSTLTNFKYLTGEWKRNCDEERLLGVSLTGIMDNGITNGGTGGLDGD